MKQSSIKKILNDINYIRTGGSLEEEKAAKYIKGVCDGLGAKSKIEEFEVQMADIKEGKLLADGKEIKAHAYKNCGSFKLKAPFMYLPNQDKASLAKVKDKIVLIDTGITYFLLKDLCENGVKGIITHDGNVNYKDNDIDQKELRAYVACGKKLPCFNINVKDAQSLVKNNTKEIEMSISQDEYMGRSRNVVAALQGERDEYITLTAHYDSTPLSKGAYDNLTGVIGLIGILEFFAKNKPKYSMKFIFCGSEERGLLGSKAYCSMHEAELDKCLLNINLDMIGTIMGKFISCISGEEKLKSYIEYLSMELGFGMEARQGVYSSDSTPFADKGVPAVSFARIAGADIAPIHNRYDTKDVLSVKQIAEDIDFLIEFTRHMVYAQTLPVKREIPENVKEDLDIYLNRKRKEDKK